MTVLVAAGGLLTACADAGSGQREGPGVIAPGSAVASAGSGSGATGEGSAVPGSDAPAGPGGTTLPRSTADALARWAGFPVTASPRPVVLLSDPVQAPANGFTDGNAKLAFLAGDIVLDSAAPTGQTSAEGYPIIDSSTAFIQLKSAGGSKDKAPTPLHVTRMALGQATFSTDRGPRPLPSWSFFFAGSSDPAQVLAVAPSARWSPPGTAGDQSAPGASYAATLAAGGATLTVSFAGNPIGPPPCGTPADGYVATAQYSATAVLVTVTASPTTLPTTLPTTPPPASNSGGSYACPAIAQQRTVSLTLDAPLGARVLLDGAGQPYEVR